MALIAVLMKCWTWLVSTSRFHKSVNIFSYPKTLLLGSIKIKKRQQGKAIAAGCPKNKTEKKGFMINQETIAIQRFIKFWANLHC